MNALRPSTSLKKVAPPEPYVSNYEVGLDVLDVKDAAGTFYDICNFVDYCTTMQQAGIVGVGENRGVPVQPTASIPSIEGGFNNTVGQNMLLLTKEPTILECSPRH